MTGFWKKRTAKLIEESPNFVTSAFRWRIGEHPFDARRCLEQHPLRLGEIAVVGDSDIEGRPALPPDGVVDDHRVEHNLRWEVWTAAVPGVDDHSPVGDVAYLAVILVDGYEMAGPEGTPGLQDQSGPSRRGLPAGYYRLRAPNASAPASTER